MPVIPFLTDVLESVPITIHIAPKVVVIFHCRQTVFSSVAVVGLVGAPRGKCQGCGGGFPHPRILNGPVCSTEPKTVFEIRVCKTTRFMLYINLDGIIFAARNQLETWQNQYHRTTLCCELCFSLADNFFEESLWIPKLRNEKKIKNKKVHFLNKRIVETMCTSLNVYATQ